MLYVVSALFRGSLNKDPHGRLTSDISQRFRIEAQHFITTLCGYFFNSGVEASWQIFEGKLDQIEERINSDAQNVTLGQNEGVDKLRDYHEKVVDRIMFVLLLRKRQQPVMKLLEEIFTIILQFSACTRQMGLETSDDAVLHEQIIEIYSKYRRKVGVFITVCRSLSEKAGYGEKTFAKQHTTNEAGLFDLSDLAEENTISQLLLTLEMSDYYDRSGAL